MKQKIKGRYGGTIPGNKKRLKTGQVIETTDHYHGTVGVKLIKKCTRENFRAADRNKRSIKNRGQATKQSARYFK